MLTPTGRRTVGWLPVFSSGCLSADMMMMMKYCVTRISRYKSAFHARNQSNCWKMSIRLFIRQLFNITFASFIAIPTYVHIIFTDTIKLSRLTFATPLGIDRTYSTDRRFISLTSKIYAESEHETCWPCNRICRYIQFHCM